MSNWIKKLVTPPFYQDDEDKTRRAEFANIIILVSLGIIVAISFFLIYFSPTPQAQLLSGVLVAAFIATLLGTLVLLALGYVRLTSILLVLAFWAAITVLIFFFGGIRTPNVAGYLLTIFIAALLLGNRGALAIGVLCMVSVLGVFLIYRLDAPPIPPAVKALTSSRGYVDWDDLFMVFGFSALMALLLGLVRRNITRSLNRASSQERALAEINRELRASRDALQDRTRELERYASQLRTAAEVTRGMTVERDLDELLNRAVRMIRDRFGFYYAVIYLTDERREYAVLRMATGEAGRQMREQGYRLRVGKTSIVGYVAATGESRIVYDVALEDGYVANPLLPDTQSQVALPLRIGTRTIGVLDVQDREVAAFGEDDVMILQTMADQLAVAIENARLVTRMQQTVRELEAASGRFTQQAWARAGGAMGYRYRQMDIEQVRESPPQVQRVWLEGQPVIESVETEGSDDGRHANLAAIPVKLRGQVIGVLTFRSTGQPISAQVVSRVEQVADRLAVALENARLLEESQRRAGREQLLSEITTRFTQSLDIDTLLRSAVHELGQLPNVMEASVHVGVPDEEGHAEAEGERTQSS